MTSNEKLKSCPICGGEAGVNQNAHDEYYVYCENRCVSTGTYRTREEAENEWNERESDGAKPLRCPFCGAETDVLHAVGFRFYVHCSNCGASQDRNYQTKAMAIREWNRRMNF